MVVILTLLVIGLLLLVSEIFLPGMIAGLAGLICLGLGVALSFRDLGVTQGGLILCATTAILVIGFFVWLKYFPDSSLAKPFVSQGQIGDIGAEQPELLGKEGVTLTPLHPSGTAIIDERHIDVVTEGEPLEKDVPVKVVLVEGMRIVVRRV